VSSINGIRFTGTSVSAVSTSIHISMNSSS
jgi:hypothetical protein